MLGNGLKREVLLERTVRAVAVIAKEKMLDNKDMTVKKMVVYTVPEMIPGNLGAIGLVVTMDTTSQIQEMSPQLLIAENSQEYYNTIQAALGQVGVSGKATAVDDDTLKQSVAYNYNSLSTGGSLEAETNADIRNIMKLIAEMVGEDIMYVKNFIDQINGDRNALQFANLSRPTPYGTLHKISNRFEFPDGIILIVKSLDRNPDGTYRWDYDAELSNLTMRGAKDDTAFTSFPNQMGQQFMGGHQPAPGPQYGQPYGQPTGYPGNGYNNNGGFNNGGGFGNPWGGGFCR